MSNFWGAVQSGVFLMCHYKKRNFPVAAVIETAQAVPITGNFETSGSKFSNETRFREAACVLCYKSEIPFLTPMRHHLMMTNKKGISP